MQGIHSLKKSRRLLNRYVVLLHKKVALISQIILSPSIVQQNQFFCTDNQLVYRSNVSNWHKELIWLSSLQVYWHFSTEIAKSQKFCKDTKMESCILDPLQLLWLLYV